MFRSYWVIAFRRLSRERVYALINILSLALGIAGFLLLALYLRSELSYDRHHVNHERIYRVVSHFTDSTSGERSYARTGGGFGPLFTQDYPQVGTSVRFRSASLGGAPIMFAYDGKQHYWDSVYLAETSVFDVFTHKVIFGNPKTAFTDPYSIALSQPVARHYFGDENPIGKRLVGPVFSFTVTLVFAELPENTHLKYDALLPLSLDKVFNPDVEKTYAGSLWNPDTYTYLFVPPGVTRDELDRLAKRFVESRMGERAAQQKSSYVPEFQPLADQHFSARLEGDQPSGNIFYVYGFVAVGLFILTIACINYTNLATARAARRAREVGMRKVLGSSRRQLITQFLGESLVFTAIALVAGLLLAALALTVGPLSAIMGKNELLESLFEPQVIAAVAALGVVVALLSGLYPAFYLAAISPLNALTAVKRSWRSGLSLRRVLVFTQLSISIAVIACTMSMASQMRYVHARPLGFDKENQLIVTLRGYDLLKHLKTIKTELKRLPNVIDVTNITMAPGTGARSAIVPVENNTGSMIPTQAQAIQVGMNLTQGLRIKLLAGREFSEDIATDLDQAVIVNESMVKQMGWTEPLGKRVMNGKVIGVVQDFHYTSLHNPIGPLIITPLGDAVGVVPDFAKSLISLSIIVSVTGENLPETMTAVRNVVSGFDPKFEFEPAFLEDRLNALYRLESDLLQLTGVFAGLCILISIIGLVGMTSFALEERTKELGVRKVLGASDVQILSLLGKPTLLLVVAAAVPASIFSYLAIESWVQNFAYREPVGWDAFALASALVLVLALSTVLVQSGKTARSEPAEALRYE